MVENLDDVTFSFIVPVYNEQYGLEKFYARLTAVAAKLKESYEIIFINDGSRDQTASIIEKLAAADTHVKAIEFSRNYGHQVAITAGYDFASGRAVISLDGDCQHPPEVIPELIARWREGFEIVYTVRKDTVGISIIRRGIGRLIYKFIGAMSGTELTDQADFRLMDRKAVDALKHHREHARFVRGLVRQLGFRQTSLSYIAEQRAAGRSNYSLKQLVNMAGAGTFNFSTKLLRLPFFVGGFFLAAACIYAITSLALWPFGMAPSWPLHLLAGMIALFGLVFLQLGIMGEYVGRIFEEAKARPLYIVRETLNFDELKQKKYAPMDEPKQEKVFRFSVYT